MTSSIIRKLRKQPWYPSVLAELKSQDADFEFVPATGRGHPKLKITRPDKTVSMPVPCSGGGATNYAYLVLEVRKLCMGPA